MYNPVMSNLDLLFYLIFTTENKVYNIISLFHRQEK